MSAWSEAVWIVKRLEQNFNFENQIDQYVGILNQARTDINNLKNSLDNINEAITIDAYENSSGNPDTGITPTEGAIWFILS